MDHPEEVGVQVIATTISGSIKDWGKVERIVPLFRDSWPGGRDPPDSGQPPGGPGADPGSGSRRVPGW